MTPLNAVLKHRPHQVGLGSKSEVREVLADMVFLIQDLQLHPTHVSQLVPPALPHFMGFCDASSFGGGGAWLPCTRHLPPLVW